MSNPDFLGLVTSLEASALAALGERNALTARLARDGQSSNANVAQRSLRLLEVLSEKTRGNLDVAEADALSEAVARVRDALAAHAATTVS